MRYRVKQGFVLGPGRLASPGDIVEIDRDEVRVNGLVLTRGPVIHPSLIEPLADDPPAESLPTREASPTNRDPDVQHRPPRAPRRRGRREE